MSSPERKGIRPMLLRQSAMSALLLSAVLVSACTVRPLYSNRPAEVGATAAGTAGLGSIAINPVKTRYAQEVRNHLIFMFNGGAGQPADARYTLELGVTAITDSAALVQVAEENEPTAGTVTLTSAYAVTDSQTGQQVASGRRQIAASYDRPRQEFATMRAQRDAENRAARELAELLKLAIAQDLSAR